MIRALVDRRDELGFTSTLRRIAGSGRVYVGLATNALSSLGNFAVSIALARTLPLGELGEFAVAFALYAFFTGFVRSAVSEPLLAVDATRGELRLFARRASLLALVAGSGAFVAGLMLSMPYIATVGVFLHGLVIFDYAKTMNLAAFTRSTALYQEAAWFVGGLVAGILVLADVVSGLVGFMIWAASGALIGYVSALIQRLQLHPTWNRGRVTTGKAAAFGGDFVIGSGSSQISFNLVGATAGLAVLGAVRAGGTLLGPIGLVVGSARTLAIPFLTRRIQNGHAAARSGAFAATSVIALVATPLLAIIAFLPDPVGTLVLGDNWKHASSLMPFLALEMLFISLTTVPFSGLRALLAGRASIILRSLLAAVRVVVVPIAAALGGATVAAIALAAVAGVSTVVWWAGYLYQLKRTLRGVS